MNQGLAGTNLWLAIIALVSLAEFLLIVTMAVVGYRLYQRATALIDRAESAYVAPTAARVNAVLAEAQEVVRRVQRLEERTRMMLARIEDTAGRVASVAQHAWPVLGTWRAVSAAMGSLRGAHSGVGPSHLTPAATAAGRREPWSVG